MTGSRLRIAVIGGGIAGASIAAELAPHADVVIIEAEDQPGVHATGRSAAFWSETYGGPLIQPLTTASADFLNSPPAGFAERGFLSPRGAVHLAHRGAVGALGELERAFEGSRVELRRLSPTELHAAVPGLRPDWTHGVVEPACSDIDVAALHAGYLAAFRRAGGKLLTGSRVGRAERVGARWTILAGDATVTSDIVVNAAGAWAEELAIIAGATPLGIRPYRRTIVQLRVDPPVPADLPLVIDIEGGFYFKGETGGRVWLSPHDETPCAPGDAAPEEIDIALAIDRLQQVVDWRVDAVERSWAGLRSFAPDRLPVYGYDRHLSGFFWCAGQGGFGIQTAPAAAKLAAALVLGTAPNASVAHIDVATYDPVRFLNEGDQ